MCRSDPIISYNEGIFKEVSRSAENTIRLRSSPDNIEPSAGAQIFRALAIDLAEGNRIHIMPDVHTGAGCHQSRHYKR